MRLNSKKVLAVTTGLGFAALTFGPLVKPLPLLIWNASESIPIGWYFVLRRPPRKKGNCCRETNRMGRIIGV